MDEEQGCFGEVPHLGSRAAQQEQLCPGPAWPLVWVGFAVCVDITELCQRGFCRELIDFPSSPRVLWRAK